MWRSGSGLLIGFSLAVVGVVMVVLVGTIVRTLRHVEPVHSTVPPVAAVAWGDRVFVGPGTLHHWLKFHGVAYSVWAERHPPADKLLQREKAHREAKLKKK
jgi:hypothetical protein